MEWSSERAGQGPRQPPWAVTRGAKDDVISTETLSLVKGPLLTGPSKGCTPSWSPRRGGRQEPGRGWDGFWASSHRQKQGTACEQGNDTPMGLIKMLS